MLLLLADQLDGYFGILGRRCRPLVRKPLSTRGYRPLPPSWLQVEAGPPSPVITHARARRSSIRVRQCLFPRTNGPGCRKLR